MTTLGPHAGGRGRRTRRLAAPRRAAAIVGGLIATLVLPSLVAAHPLGNFTINHYAGLRVESDRILLDVVIDQAEIPTFQARLDLDTDADGELSDTETESARLAECRDLATVLDLRVDGQAQPLILTETGLIFPAGAGGLSTMRLVCGFEATLETPLANGALITFADRSFAERIGWREIVVEGSGVSISSAPGATLRSASPSARLTAYPEDLLAQVPADTEVALVVTPGGPVLPAFDIPDADAIASLTGAVTDPASQASDNPAPAEAAVVPGGIVGDEIPSIFRSVDLTPFVLFVSLVTAAGLGAGHALTPGHGKTLIAAYLVGSRGTPVHAAGLGLSVALSHTLGILLLAALVVGAQSVLPPDVVIRTAPILAAGSIVVIGGWMLVTDGRRRWRIRGAQTIARHDPDHGHAPHDSGGHEDHDGPDHSHDHEPSHDHDHDHSPEHAHARGHDYAHGHAHGHDPEPSHQHNHGGRTHSHLPAPGSTISWRSLFVLGLAGGLIPSANALVILLVSIAAGRPAFGFVLVVAFGLGMALVMGGIGIAMTLARGRLDRIGAGTRLGRASAYLPLAASVFVFSFGVFLTIQAVSGSATF